MTRVVQVSFHRDRHGRSPEELLAAWTALPGTASAAARAGVDVAVVQPAAEDRALERDGVVYRFVSAPFGRRRGPADTRPVAAGDPSITDAVRSLAPELVHVQGLALPGHARRLKESLGGVPVLAQDHADRPPRPWRRPAARRAARAAWDGVAFTVRDQAEPFRAARMLRPDAQVHEVLEASTDFGPGDREEARRLTGIHGGPALLWLGRLDPNKDPLTVLDALAQAASGLPDPHLWCCYRDAPLLRAVRARVASDPRLAGRVHLLGERPRREVELLLRAADALVQGSHREGSGFAVLEALACGTPAVVTDIAPLRRIVGPDLSGLLWPPGDASACARALVTLGPVSATSRDRALHRFRAALDWDAVGRELAAAWESVLAASRPAPGGGARARAAPPRPGSVPTAGGPTP